MKAPQIPLVVVMLPLLTTLISPFGLVVAQSQPEQTTIPPVQSIFPEDICAPPCWMGLVAGESTTLDVQKMFHDQAVIFDHDCAGCDDPSSDIKSDRAFEFKWRNYDRLDMPTFPEKPANFQYRSWIRFDTHSKIDTIRIEANHRIVLSELLSKLGKPDVIYLDKGRPEDDFDSARWLLLVFIPIQLQVYLWTFPTTVCSAESVQEDFNVNFLVYYSIEAASKPVPPDSYNVLQTESLPALLTPLAYGRQIPLERWEQFINGKGYEDCEDFYNSLPTDFVVPTLPWSSPTLTPC